MSTTTVSRRDLRVAIRRHIEGHDAPTWSEIVAAVAGSTGAEPTAVGRELDELEEQGFIYCVPSEDGEEVKLV